MSVTEPSVYFLPQLFKLTWPLVLLSLSLRADCSLENLLDLRCVCFNNNNVDLDSWGANELILLGDEELRAKGDTLHYRTVVGEKGPSHSSLLPTHFRVGE